MLAGLGIAVTCSDLFGAWGSAWLDGLALGQPYAGKVTSLRQLIGELTSEITMVSEVLAGLLAGHRGYGVIQRLPGIGPVLAAVIIAEIGDVTRFRTPGQLASWSGLTPGHRESDIKVTRGHVTKQGSRLLRWALIEAIQRGPRRVPRARRQGRDHRPPQQASPQHRQGRRRPAAAHPGLLRAARRPDPLPARTRPGRVSAPRPAGREAVPKSVPRPRAAGRRPDWPRPALTTDATCPMPPAPAGTREGMTAASGTARKGNQSSTWGSQNSITITQPPASRFPRPGRVSAPGRPRQGRPPGAGNAGQACGLVPDPATRSHEPAAISGKHHQ